MNIPFFSPISRKVNPTEHCADCAENPVNTTLADASPSFWALTLPVAAGYFPLGAVFGFLFVQAGGSAWLPGICALLIYGGASQYMMVPMVAAGVSLPTIALATLVINFRHVFYGFSLIGRLPQSFFARWYTVFALTDETYAVLSTLPSNAPRMMMFKLALANHTWWIMGCALGGILGAQMPSTLQGLDFVLASLFAMLTVEQWRSRQRFAPLIIAALCYALALLIYPQQALLLAISLSVLMGSIPALNPAVSTPVSSANQIAGSQS